MNVMTHLMEGPTNKDFTTRLNMLMQISEGK